MKNVVFKYFMFVGILVLFNNLFAVEQDLFENISLRIPSSLSDEITSLASLDGNVEELLPFDEDLLLEEYSNIGTGLEQRNYSSEQNRKIYVPTNARRTLVSTNLIITELAILGFPQTWSNDNGLSRKGKDLVKFIKESYAHGLVPNDYSYSQLRSNLPSDEIEVIASKAFVDITNDILLGRLYPHKADYDWHVRQNDQIAVSEILWQSLYSSDIVGLLTNKLPQSSIYTNLSKKLNKYKKLKRGWYSFPEKGPKLELGSEHGHIEMLRRRLATSGYLRLSKGSKKFDEKLKVALVKFQSEHGLNRSGILTPRTRKALSISIESRITQLEQSLERIRWMPNFLPIKYIIVNIAGSELSFRENNYTTLNMRTVVGGKRKNLDSNTETPSFNKTMKYIIVNPEWYVPQSIIKNEFIPEIKKDANYLTINNYQVYDGSGETKIDPKDINWEELPLNENIPYQVRQGIGDSNALGRIKFMFPNKHSIYLHDTPSKSLFRHENRFYSHGCVRLARPVDLASKILKISKLELKEIISTGERTKIVLDEQIPVYIAYITAWARDDGTVVFYDDFYGLDERMKNNFF